MFYLSFVTKSSSRKYTESVVCHRKLVIIKLGSLIVIIHKKLKETTHQLPPSIVRNLMSLYLKVQTIT